MLKIYLSGAITGREAELNEDEIFKNEMDLDGEQPDFDGYDNLDNTVDNKIDYNMYRFVDINKTDAKKEFDESKINRNAKGQFAEKNESGDSDNDKKDNSKDADNDKEGMGGPMGT